MNPSKWTRWEKFGVGAPSAYICAAVAQLLFHDMILNRRAHSFSDGLATLFDPKFFDLYFGIRWLRIVFETMDAVNLLMSSVPVILFLLLPNVFTWLFLMICLNVAFFIPALMGV